MKIKLNVRYDNPSMVFTRELDESEIITALTAYLVANEMISIAKFKDIWIDCVIND